jgi:predicted protein tyrosine phosphatase
MIKKIVVLSRQWVERSIKESQKIAEIEGSWAIISIYTDHILLNLKSIETLKTLGCEEYLSLRFADITKENYEKDKNFYDEKNLIIFTIEHAQQIINFINKVNRNDKIQTLVVHCSAGVSRSGAVGFFACRYLHTNEKEFWKTNPNIAPNSHILDVLHKVSGMKDDYIKFWDNLAFDSKYLF